MRAWLSRHLDGWRPIAILAVLTLIIWLAGRGLPDGRLHVYFLDVGQGDAIFVVAPDGRQVLIDGGPSPEALLNELGRVMPFWDRSLDLLVLTHLDADHVTGLYSVLTRYRVAQVLDDLPQDLSAVPAASLWADDVAAAHAARLAARPGMRLFAGEAAFTVLYAGEAGPGGAAPATDSDNNDSLVVRLDYGGTAFLLTGDAEQQVEARLIGSGLPLRADVLKVGHHGSERATSLPFVGAVAPRLAVIQVGAGNRYGHPQPAVLQRLAGSRVLRTDQNGRVEVISDGQRLTVATTR
jgi:competence protein ComEC